MPRSCKIFGNFNVLVGWASLFFLIFSILHTLFIEVSKFVQLKNLLQTHIYVQYKI